jgi:hypothetical protein
MNLCISVHSQHCVGLDPDANDIIALGSQCDVRSAASAASFT